MYCFAGYNDESITSQHQHHYQQPQQQQLFQSKLNLTKSSRSQQSHLPFQLDRRTRSISSLNNSEAQNTRRYVSFCF